MADAWGGSWGVSWGVSWGAGTVAPTPEPPRRRGAIDLRKLQDNALEFERREQASKAELRAAIERAFADPVVEPQVVATAPARREIAKAVLIDIRTDGLTASLGRIERMVAEYARLIEEEREEEEAVVALLLMH